MQFVPEQETAPKPPFDFHIVLIEPEIPPNTGNAGRLCVATQSTLHIVGKPAFNIDDKAVRRAGLDYWKYVKLMEHKDFDAFLNWRENHNKEMALFFLETYGKQNFYDTSIPKCAALIFGKETTGVPLEILQKYQRDVFNIPMFSEKIRSLNLSNTIALVLYESIRQNLPVP